MMSQVHFHSQQNHLCCPKAELGSMRAICAAMHVEPLTRHFFFPALRVCTKDQNNQTNTVVTASEQWGRCFAVTF